MWWKRLHKFLRLPRREQGALLKTSALMLFIKMGLRWVPFQALSKFLYRFTQNRHGVSSDPLDMYRTLAAVEMSGRHTPGPSTCLVLALTAQVLLLRQGYPSELKIGIARGSQAELEAHAWVVLNGDVLIGYRHDLQRYQVLPGLEEKLR